MANPTAGGRRRRRRLEQAIQLLRSRLTVRAVRWTERRGDAEQWAREAVQEKAAAVFGAGGDGTLNELANGLAASDTALGILPVGTVNVVACELNIPLDPLEAARVLLDGKIDRIHLGHAEFEPLPAHPTAPTTADSSNSSFILHPSSFRARRFFLFAAGLGFDAYICHCVNERLKQWAHKGAYVLDGLRLFVRYRSPRLRVALEGGEAIACSELIVCNARSYAGRHWVAPDASLHKPRLDACLFLRPGRWNLLRYGLGIWRGCHINYPDVLCRETQSLEVTAETPAYLHLDGDATGTPPVSLSVQPNALAVLVPSAR